MTGAYIKVISCTELFSKKKQRVYTKRIITQKIKKIIKK